VRIHTTRHLDRRLAARHITMDDVRSVLQNPLTTWPDPKNQSRVITGKSVDGRMLRVCCVDPVPPDGVEVVKTAMWLDT
jgi:Domain of unknown function (DUF4258)